MDQGTRNVKCFFVLNKSIHTSKADASTKWMPYTSVNKFGD